MKKYLIYQHLGLGDHIITNALVRSICKTDGDFEIVTLPSRYDSVCFMFRDVKNLKPIIINVPDLSNEEYNIVGKHATANGQEIIRIGHELSRNDINFDKSFYLQFNYDFQNRWEKFKVIRDLEREEAFFNNFNLNEDYIFLHEDSDRGMSITRKLYGDIRVIRAEPKLSKNIFDYLTLIERAKEVHVIESSFMFMIDSFNFVNPLFAHRYARNYPARNTPTLKLEWNILT